MINNIDLIRPLMEFPNPGDSFYFVQILQRKKDNKENNISNSLLGSNNNSRLIKSYYISKIEQLDRYWDEMCKIADLFQSRVGINLNPRSFEKTAYKTLIKMSNQMHNRDFYNIGRAYNSACGEYQSEIDKRWIVDIDTLDKQVLNETENLISNQYSSINNFGKKPNYKLLCTLPSKSGYHIICNPFDIKILENIKNSNYIEIHKNNPTNLYIS